ncbi:unnamed protein product [Rotaria sordida]|uniref:Apple domain-containing protein n=1 Tax=Rotaria sordida TaxID=392033 RepID=A0A813XKT8_9BILA|nr:unnamed protein product [Rotaria sordida]CAF0866374.1 unnamed protein product [Rotaria sordida]CAF1469523.1 unnamed protein product [Rotaria sordida]
MDRENSQYYQRSDWSTFQPSTLHHENSFINPITNKVHPTNIELNSLTQHQSKDFKKTKWKLPCESQQCPTRVPIFVQGLVLGVLIGCLMLTIALPLWLTSNYNNTTISSTTSISTVTTSTTATSAYYSCSNFTIRIYWNYPNNDIAWASPMSFYLCCLWCLDTSACTAFVLTNTTSTCWIKTTTGGAGYFDSTVIAATR